MKKFFLILCFLVFVIGCGGGGSGPTLPPAGDRDLSGLEGHWTGMVSYSGTIHTDDGDFPMAQTIPLDWIITRTSITADVTNQWSYNGTTLTVHNSVMTTSYSYDCGDMYITVVMNLSIPITPGATYANIGGTFSIDGVSDFCGAASGTMTVSGNMTKN